MPIDVRIPARDTPRAWTLALVAILGGGVGLGLAAWAQGRERSVDAGLEAAPSGQASREEPAPARATGSAGLEDTGHEAIADAGSLVAPVTPDAGAGLDAGASPDAGVALAAADAGAEVMAQLEGQDEPSAAAPAAGLVFRRGRVAYIRCDGVPPSSGPLPCPRDERLESSVWTILERVQTCATGPRQAGEADVRLEFTGPGAPGVVWRDTFPAGTVRLDSEAVLSCVRGPLSRTSQSLGATRMLVSFRFGLVAE